MKPIERIDDRRDAILAAMQAHFSARVVQAGWQHYREQAEADLQQGVVMLVIDGESDYSERLGMAAKAGTTTVLLVCHAAVDQQTQTQADLQDLELDIAEECKAFVRAGVDGIGLGLQSINTSRQLEYPYGFVVARVDAGAPEATTH